MAQKLAEHVFSSKLHALSEKKNHSFISGSPAKHLTMDVPKEVE
jgi:hypothetical protein